MRVQEIEVKLVEIMRLLPKPHQSMTPDDWSNEEEAYVLAAILLDNLYTEEERKNHELREIGEYAKETADLGQKLIDSLQKGLDK